MGEVIVDLALLLVEPLPDVFDALEVRELDERESAPLRKPGEEVVPPAGAEDVAIVVGRPVDVTDHQRRGRLAEPLLPVDGALGVEAADVEDLGIIDPAYVADEPEPVLLIAPRVGEDQ